MCFAASGGSLGLQAGGGWACAQSVSISLITDKSAISGTDIVVSAASGISTGAGIEGELSAAWPVPESPSAFWEDTAQPVLEGFGGFVTGALSCDADRMFDAASRIWSAVQPSAFALTLSLTVGVEVGVISVSVGGSPCWRE